MSLLDTLKRIGNQINPLDNGRTYSNPNPTNNNSLLQQLAHNPVTNIVGGAVKPVVQFLNTGELAKQQAVNTVRMLAAQVTHNPTAFQHANQTSQNIYANYAAPNGGLFRQGTFF